jgi:uncharacterized membrane protein YhaH (DUF805 family)
MTNDELLYLASRMYSLDEEARSLLTSELEHRSIGPDEIHPYIDAEAAKSTSPREGSAVADFLNPYIDPEAAGSTPRETGNKKTSTLDTLFSFEGRTPRQTFWTVALLIFVLNMGLKVLTVVGSEYGPLILVLAIPAAWIGLANCVKRCHDVDGSGWWALTLLIPLVNIVPLVILGTRPGTAGTNKYGPDPISASSGVFAQGVSLIEKGDTQQALETFKHALDKAISNNDRGKILFNMAICNLRLGKKQDAIGNLTEAVTVLPSLKPAIARDKDLAELHDDERLNGLVF